MGRTENQSEMARLLGQIRQEYEAAMNGMSGLAAGNARHAFITARMENMGGLHKQLEELMGDGIIATELVVAELEQVAERKVQR